MGDQGRLPFFTSLTHSSRGAVMEAGLVQQRAGPAGGSTAVLSEQRLPAWFWCWVCRGTRSKACLGCVPAAGTRHVLKGSSSGWPWGFHGNNNEHGGERSGSLSAGACAYGRGGETLLLITRVSQSFMGCGSCFPCITNGNKRIQEVKRLHLWTEHKFGARKDFRLEKIKEFLASSPAQPLLWRK